ncbi:MAG: amino acid transporter, partial [Thermomicrobiales bacterium]
GAVFLKGFGEAIGIAVVLVAAYLALNAVVVTAGIFELVRHPDLFSNWRIDLSQSYSSPITMVGSALLLFPALALGLSGFETGVVVMPLVKGDADDKATRPAGRIRNTRTMLTAAALVMSVFLLASSVITITLIPSAAFEVGGEANGRALAYLAHDIFGNAFGTVYDISTVFILWFAGASAMAGLLNIVPRYLPRYGMAPDWARATRPLVLIFTLICFLVTILFRAKVDAQAGAYATGVLAVITSATIAVTLSAHRHQQTAATLFFGLIAVIFIYTTLTTIIERPEGLKIALIFIAAIIIMSLVSRAWRSTELRVEHVKLDKNAMRFLKEATRDGLELRIIANHPDDRTPREYLLKEREEREASNIPVGQPVVFLEVTVADASQFTHTLLVRGVQIGPYRVLRASGASIPNAIAAFALYARDETGKLPHVYFGWTEGNPLKYLARFILFGEGDMAPTTHEVLRQAEPDPKRRPAVHVG